VGLVHRDVSPQNVLLTYDGAVKLVDFGTAREGAARAPTQPGAIHGKVGYMAPEQLATGEPVDARADVFAAAVVLFELVTGARYWEGQTEAQIVRALLERPAPRAALAVDPSLPPSLESVLARGLAPDPAQRHPSAAAFREALAAVPTGTRGAPSALCALLDANFSATRGALRVRIGADLPAAAPPRPAEIWLFAAIALAAVAAAVGGAAALRRRPAVPSPVSSAPSHAAAAAACASSSDCPADRVCRGGRCIALAAEGCRVLAPEGAARDPRTLWIGTMFRTSTDDATGRTNEDGVRLAVEELQRVAGGVPSIEPSRPPRPLGLVTCDDAADPARVARHLTEDVRVPVVIGFGTSQEVLDLAGGVLLPAGTLSLVTANGSSAIPKISMPPGARRLWRTTTAGETSKALARLVPQLAEPWLRRAGAIAPGEPMRVALLRDGGAMGLSTADVYESELTFNGRRALENGDDFLDEVVAESDEAAPAVVDRLSTFAPHVILASLPFERTFASLVAALERAWPSGRARPLYFEDTTLIGDQLVTERPDVRARLFGVYSPLKSKENGAFTARFNQGRAAPLPYTEVPGPPYDAAYVAVVAAAAQPEGEVTGAALAAAISRLSRGERVPIGPEGVAAAMAALRARGEVDLVGTSSNLDFDPATGDVFGDMVLDCDRQAPDGGGFVSDEIDVTYDGREQRWRGRLVCP